jgi:hypothetical protein
MRALKALVIVMGVLLVGGSATLAVLMVKRLAGPARRQPAASAMPARASVALPPGTEVQSVSALGERLAVYVAGRQGNLILIVDPATGAVVETIELKAAAP